MEPMNSSKQMKSPCQINKDEKRMMDAEVMVSFVTSLFVIIRDHLLWYIIEAA